MQCKKKCSSCLLNFTGVTAMYCHDIFHYETQTTFVTHFCTFTLYHWPSFPLVLRIRWPWRRWAFSEERWVAPLSRCASVPELLPQRKANYGCPRASVVCQKMNNRGHRQSETQRNRPRSILFLLHAFCVISNTLFDVFWQWEEPSKSSSFKYQQNTFH